MQVEVRRKSMAVGIWFAGAMLAASAANAASFNFELRELLTDENPFARHIYLCPDCTLAEFDAIPLPGPNWEKNATATSARLFLGDSETNIPPVLDPSVPTELDLDPTIPGPELFLFGKVLSGGFVGFDPGSGIPVLNAQVARGTTIQWDSGRVIHKSVSPSGDEYVLISIDEEYSQAFDIDAVGGMAGVPLAPGWTYTSELLTSDFAIGTPTGIASVLLPGGGVSTWQKVVPVPEPSTGLLAGIGFIALGLMALRARRRSR